MNNKILAEIKEKYTNPPIAEKIDGIDYALVELDDLSWFINQAEHRNTLQDRLQKRGIERKRMISTIKRQRRKIEKLEWDLMV